MPDFAGDVVLQWRELFAEVFLGHFREVLRFGGDGRGDFLFVGEREVGDGGEGEAREEKGGTEVHEYHV